MRKALIVLAVAFAAILPASVAAGQEDEQQECHEAYEPCVPIADDVDCLGGGGNGPEFVEGPITVLDPEVDPYDLDRDGNGIGCENGEDRETTTTTTAPPEPVPSAPPVEEEPSFTG